MKNQLTAVFLAASLTSPWVVAQEIPSYSFAEIAYTSFDAEAIESDGFKLKGSAALSENVFIAVDFTNTKGEIDTIDFDFNTQAYGIGFNFDRPSGNSWFVSYMVDSWDLDDAKLDVDVLRLGFRNQIEHDLEVSMSVTSNDIENDQRENGYQLGLAYEFSPNVLFTIDYDTIRGDIDLTNLSFGIRRYF